MAKSLVKRAAVVGVVVAALGGSGVAGAVAVGNTTVVNRGSWAHLLGSKVYCHAIVEKHFDRLGFDCATWDGDARLANSYSAVVDTDGVEVDRWDAAGTSFRRVRTYTNP